MNNKKKTIWSAFISVAMLFFSYWVSNLDFPLPISGERALINGFEAVHNYIWPRQNKTQDVLAINVSRNKQLISNDNSKTTIAVTDRKALKTLLTRLKQKDDYRYIMLDIDFSVDDKTDNDSALWSVICEMRDIVLFRNLKEDMPDERMYKKAGIAGYNATPTESDFVKYPYIESMPLKMYQDRTNRNVEHSGPIYHDGWHLARKSVILNFDYIPDNDSTLDLGECVTKVDSTDIYIIDMMPTKDKYILIGAFKDEDIHSTYLGPMSGIAINFNAFLSLMNGHHHVSLALILLLFCVFFSFSFLIFSQRDISISMINVQFSHKKWTRIFQRVLILVCSWIGFTMVLSFLCIITYVCLDEVYDILATSTLFGLLNVIVKLYNIVTYEK